MALEPGARLGPYEVEAPLGAGGMGEVYRAHDPRLDRRVAIKVLPEQLARDPAFRERFESEARAVAALSHPNVLAVHDFGIDGEIAYLVLELLEGETLAERLAPGALPVRKAVEIAAQAARGLAAAHERGIVHRDVKPSNLFLTRDGQVKLLDFGLARAAISVDADAGTEAATLAATEPGTVMGTVGYMSPEQVRGERVDARSDVFSLGVVLWETLVGRRPFARETAAETMTAILREEPPEASSIAGPLPPALERIVRRCLEKRPEERFQSAQDLAFALNTVTLESGSAPASTAAGPRRRRPASAFPWAALLLIGVAGIFLGLMLRPAPPAAAPVKVRQLTFSGADSQPSVAPDGRLLAFTSSRDGQSRIWLKQLAGGGEQPLTVGPDWRPRFSPDGSSVLFLRDEGGTQALYRTPLVGGAPRKLLEDVVEAAWSPEGERIAFLRADRTGSKMTVGLLTLESAEETVVHEGAGWDYIGLSWSPDGRRLVATRASPAAIAVGLWGVFEIDPESGRVRVLFESPGLLSAPAFTPSGDLVFAATDNIMGMVSGEPARVMRLEAARHGELAFWARDLFAYMGTLNISTRLAPLPPQGLVFDTNRQTLSLLEVDLESGRERVLTGGTARDRQPAYSPDGRAVVFSTNRSGSMDLFLFDTASGELRQLTEGPAQDWDPAFTPDGRHVLFSSDRSGNLEIWEVRVDGTGARQLSRNGVSAENPGLTSNGRWLVYFGGDPQRPGLVRMRPDGGEEEQLREGFVTVPDLSPDGRYVAYVVVAFEGFRSRIEIVEVESGSRVPFEIEVPWGPMAPNVTFGRARWWPDGSALAFVGLDEQGRTGVFLQDFVPGEDTADSRRPLAGFRDDLVTESFALSPDGERITLALLREDRNLMLAENVEGIE